MTALISDLITAGHSYGDILDRYTLDEAFAYRESAIRGERQRMALLFVGVRNAHGAKASDWKSFIDELTAFDDGTSVGEKLMNLYDTVTAAFGRKR